EASFIHSIRGDPNLFAIVSWPLSHAGLEMTGRYYGVYAYQRAGATLTENTFVTHHSEVAGGIDGTVEGGKATFDGTTEAGLIALMGSQGKWTWQAKCNRAGTQLELTACAYVEQIEAGEELKEIRQRFIARYADTPGVLAEKIDRFDESQRLWQAQLEHDLDALFPLGAGENLAVSYGSSYSMQWAYARAFLSRQRAEFLRTY